MRSREIVQAEFDDITKAIQAVLLNQSYTLDTGQSRRVVQRADLATLRNLKIDLISELNLIDNRIGGFGLRGRC